MIQFQVTVTVEGGLHARWPLRADGRSQDTAR